MHMLQPLIITCWSGIKYYLWS